MDPYHLSCNQCGRLTTDFLQLLVSPGMEIANVMDEILPAPLRPEVSAALVSLFEGCGRDQNLLMWSIQKEIEMCNQSTSCPLQDESPHYYYPSSGD